MRIYLSMNLVGHADCSIQGRLEMLPCKWESFGSECRLYYLQILPQDSTQVIHSTVRNRPPDCHTTKHLYSALQLELVPEICIERSDFNGAFASVANQPDP